MPRTLVSYDFSAGGNGVNLLGHGWADPGRDGVWSLGGSCSLAVPPVDGAGERAVALTLDPQIKPGVGRRRVLAASLNGEMLAERWFAGRCCWQLSLPPDAIGRVAKITLSARNTAAASERGVRLSRLDVIAGRAVTARKPPIELRFGWNETTESWLGEGFGAPEDSYVWAIGGTSTLVVPVPPTGEPLLVLLDMRPFHRPGAAPGQRIVVWEGEGPELPIALRERLIVAIPLRPKPGQTKATLHFRNIDADFETTDKFYHFGRPFAWALHSLRIVPALPRYFPGLRPRMPGTLADGSMQLAVLALTGAALPDLLDGFVSLGNFCELGQLQVGQGRDRPGLLRFATIRQNDLVEGLFQGFADAAQLQHLDWEAVKPGYRHWYLVDRLSGMCVATPYPNDVKPPDNAFHLASRRLPRLAERLMEDVAEGGRIFLMRPPDPVDETAAIAVQAALRHVGDAVLVWLVSDGTQRPGSVERLASGVMRGHVEAPPAFHGATADTVASILANAFILDRQAQRLPP